MRHSINRCTPRPVDIRQRCRYAFALARSGGAASPGMSTAVRRAVSSAGRALPSQGRGREFESPTVHRLLGQATHGRLAQRESAVFTRQKSQVQILYRPFENQRVMRYFKLGLQGDHYLLSQLPWRALRLAPQYGFGYGQISRHALRAPLPSHLSEDVQRLIARRLLGRAPMVDYRVQAVQDTSASQILGMRGA